MQRICAILCLDEQTKTKIQAFRDTLVVNYGIPSKELYPHITLAHYEAIDKREIIKYSDRFAREIHQFVIRYDSIDVLTGNCIACMPNPKGKITDLYNIYHTQFDSYCDKWTKKENGLWIPHITIYGNSDSRIEEMKTFLKKDFVPFEGKVIGFELSQKNEDGFEIIYSKDLV